MAFWKNVSGHENTAYRSSDDLRLATPISYLYQQLFSTGLSRRAIASPIGRGVFFGSIHGILFCQLERFL